MTTHSGDDRPTVVEAATTTINGSSMSPHIKPPVDGGRFGNFIEAAWEFVKKAF